MALKIPGNESGQQQYFGQKRYRGTQTRALILPSKCFTDMTCFFETAGRAGENLFK